MLLCVRIGPIESHSQFCGLLTVHKAGVIVITIAMVVACGSDAGTRPSRAHSRATEVASFYDGFEKSQPTWNVALNNDWSHIKSWSSHGPVSRVRGDSRDGHNKLRFEVDPKPTSYRSEIKRPTVPMDSEYWYGFSLNVPTQWKRDPKGSILAQWHALVDRPVDNYPVASLYLIDDTWQIRLNWNTVGDTSEGPGWGRKTFPFGKVRKGLWTDWVVHAKWSHRPDGLFEVWQDGKKLLEYRGPTEYVNTNGPWFKMGIYHPAWRTASAKIPPGTIPLVSYADDVRFARNGSFNAVMPR